MSRNNLFKSGYYVVNENERRIIDSNAFLAKIAGNNRKPDSFAAGEAAGIELQEHGKPDAIDLLFMEESEKENLQNAGYMGPSAEEIIEQAKAEAEEILNSARKKAEQQKQSLYESAKEEGYRNGYEEAQQRVMEEAEKLEEKYRQLQNELVKEYREQADELEPMLVDKLTDIYEHVFRVELSGYRTVLEHLISNTLRSLEVGNDYLVKVSTQDYPYISMQKAVIMEEAGIRNATVELVEDMTLSKNECLIETENGIFDCSLDSQLSELKKKLKLLSYTGQKE